MKKNFCITCGQPVWKGNKYFRNFWQLYCWNHEPRQNDMYGAKIEPYCKICGAPIGEDKSFCEKDTNICSAKCSDVFWREQK